MPPLKVASFCRSFCKDSSYGYWEMLDDGNKRSADLKHCDKFRFWIFAYLFYMDQIAYGSKIIKVEI